MGTMAEIYDYDASNAYGDMSYDAAEQASEQYDEEIAWLRERAR